MENHLNRELLKRVFGNLGAVPGPNFGRVGITLNDFLFNKQITMLDEDNSKYDCLIWMGETKIGSTYRVALTNLNTVDEPEFILLFKIENDSPLGLRLIWDENDFGSFMSLNNKFWHPVSMLRKLNFTAGIELLTQEGAGWYPCQDDALYSLLLSLVDFDAAQQQ